MAFMSIAFYDSCRWTKVIAFVVSLAFAEFARGAPFDELDVFQESDIQQPDKQATATSPIRNTPAAQPTVDEDSPPVDSDSALRPVDPAERDLLETLASAQSAFRQQNFEQCLEELIVAVAKHPYLPPPKLMLAEMYYSASMWPQGRQTLESAALEDPAHPELLRVLGKVALIEQRWTEAVMHFEKGLQMAPEVDWPQAQRDKFIFSCREGLATASQQRGDWHKAVATLREIVESQPKNSVMRDRWASALFNAGQHDKAYEQFKTSYVLAGGISSPPEVSMGVMELSRNNVEQADAWFSKATAKYPDDPEVYYQISLALMVQDRAREAAQHAATAERLGMSSPQLAMVRGYAARQLEHWDSAVALFRTVAAESPEDPAVLNQLALCLVELRDRAPQDEALEIAQSVARQQPDAARARATLGWIHFKLGNIAEAEPLMRQVAAQPAAGPESLYLAGRFFHEQEHSDLARHIADRLANALSPSGIFVLRPQARQWVKTVYESANK